MLKRWTICTMLLPAVLVTVGAAGGGAVAYGQDLEARADRILRDMGAYLSSAEEFRFQADVSYDTLWAAGQMIQYGGVADVAVRRPNRLRVEFDGDEDQYRVVYDGEEITVYQFDTNVYAVSEGGSGIDDAIDRVFDLSGNSEPIADLVYADPYAVLSENVEAGFVVGRHSVGGTPCHHLAFSQQEVDWQIWIEDGPRPLPRKLVITYKNEPGAPRYIATMSGWDFQPRVSDHYFEFRPPPGADEIEFRAPPEEEEEELEP